MNMNTETRTISSPSSYKVLDYVWLALMALTLGTAWVAESADPNLLATLLIAASIGIKGRLVVERFMELRNAHPYIRFAMNLYFYLLPLAIVLVFLFPETLAELTRLRR